MSPAKRKVGSRKGRGSRAKRAKKAATCGIPTEELAAAMDRPEAAAPVLSHVPGCAACTTSLTVLAASGHGLKNLTADGAGTAIEKVLARGQAHGQRKLADLVYELLKACLVAVQDVDRRLHLEQRPRNGSIIRGEVRGVVSRLTERERSAERSLPQAIPIGDRALTAADGCIRILDQLEGPSDRQRLGRAVWLICRGEPAAAQADLEGLLEADRGGPVRLHALRNLQWALNRQRNYRRAVEVGRRAVAEYPADWQLAYNFTVSSAGVGDIKLFRQAARQLTRKQPATADGSKFRKSVLAYEADRFAEKLGVPLREVEAAFGVEAFSVEGN